MMPRPEEIEAAADDLRTLIGRLRRRLARESPPGLPSMSEGSVLSLLERRGSCTQAEASRALGMQPQSLGAIIAALQARGLVIRERDPGDRRAFRVRPTPEGVHTVSDMRKSRNAWLANAMNERLDDHEKVLILDSIDLLKRLLDD